jgi:N-acyl-L-homoserine lactone synthetase
LSIMQNARCDEALQVEDECTVVIANTPELISECLRLRYQVYCVEKGFEPGRNGIETDPFDKQARHVLLIHRASGEPIGTVRVIPPTREICINDFPMARAGTSGLLDDMPPLTTGEISRFAVSKHRRLRCGAGTMVRLGLMQGVLRVSVDLGLTHWCAIMEPMLLRLLQRNAIHFVPLGPLVEYHGMRQPSFAEIGRVLSRTQYEQWRNWEYVTAGGTLWRSAHASALSASARNGVKVQVPLRNESALPSENWKRMNSVVRHAVSQS